MEESHAVGAGGRGSVVRFGLMICACALLAKFAGLHGKSKVIGHYAAAIKKTGV